MFKIRHFEFWNTHLFHLPIYLYWLYLSCKARSLFFFSAANPGIENGGLMGESKYKILQKINQVFVPKTCYYQTAPAINTILTELACKGISFPFIVKPDIGQGGWLIDMIYDEQELSCFLNKIKMPFMIQEYVDAPVEIGLLYYRLPGEKRGTISSLAVKELLSVTGDGINDLRSLAMHHPRAKKQLKRVIDKGRIDLDRILPRGEKFYLSFVGNHSYGTMFLNGNHLIDQKMLTVFDNLCKGIPGFYFGRFDIRCENIEALKRGEFKILELNGVGSEPLHIFDPKETLKNAYKVALSHWRVIYEISKRNCKSQPGYMKLTEAWETYKNVTRIQRIHQTSITIGN
jgi:hypothetical protein